MLSRVADSIYWMSRYVERAENIARAIDVNYNLALDLGPEMGNHWGPLISTTGDHDAFYARYDVASERQRDLVLDVRRGEPELDHFLPGRPARTPGPSAT